MREIAAILTSLAVLLVLTGFGVEIWHGNVTNNQNAELYTTIKLSRESCEKVTGAAYKRLRKVHKQEYNNFLKEKFKRYALPEGYEYVDESTNQELLALIAKRRIIDAKEPYGTDCVLKYYIGL